MLKEDFVPVAIDQFFQRKQDDAEGRFYRKIAGQGPRSDFNATTQGRYVCSADGHLFGYNNNRGPAKIRQIMIKALEEFKARAPAKAKPIEKGKVDSNWSINFSHPKIGLILRSHSKVLDGYDSKKPTDWTKVFHDSVGRDNAWMNQIEKQNLVLAIEQDTAVPTAILRRIARFNFLDNTRGEPPRWTNSDIKLLELDIEKGVMTGKVHLETRDGSRGFIAELYGHAEATENDVVRFDLLAKGDFWGTGRFTHFGPEGKFPLAIALRIADMTDPADKILPHGAKGWVAGYIELD